MPHLKAGSCIINTTSVNAYKGHPSLLSYTVTKGGIVALIRSLALSLADKGIRVNGKPALAALPFMLHRARSLYGVLREVKALYCTLAVLLLGGCFRASIQSTGRYQGFASQYRLPREPAALSLASFPFFFLSEQALPRVPSGPLSSRPPSRRRRSRASEPRLPCSAWGSPRRSDLRTCSWPATTPLTSQARSCTPTVSLPYVALAASYVQLLPAVVEWSVRSSSRGSIDQVHQEALSVDPPWLCLNIHEALFGSRYIMLLGWTWCVMLAQGVSW